MEQLGTDTQLWAKASYPLVGAFGDAPNIPRMLAESPYVIGEFTFCTAGQLEHHVTVEQVAEVTGGHVERFERDSDDGTWRAFLTVPHSWTAYVTCTPGRTGRAEVFGAHRHQTDELLQALQRTSSENAPAHVDGLLDVQFHYQGARGITTRRRAIDVPPWAEIRTNYSTKAAEHIDALMNTQPPVSGGRLILMHGEPGTGKTTLIRALAREWAPWCETSYVLDPDALFGDAGYVHELLLEEADRDDDLPAASTADASWRLVVIEDADELITANARNRVGQALGRLLNVTDGMLGQGLRNIVLITTNEPIHSLHTALTRPGRCLANLEIGRLTASEARAWLPAEQRHGVPDSGATLAQLYEMVRVGVTSQPETAPQPIGMYL